MERSNEEPSRDNRAAGVVGPGRGARTMVQHIETCGVLQDYMVYHGITSRDKTIVGPAWSLPRILHTDATSYQDLRCLGASVRDYSMREQRSHRARTPWLVDTDTASKMIIKSMAKTGHTVQSFNRQLLGPLGMWRSCWRSCELGGSPEP